MTDPTPAHEHGVTEPTILEQIDKALTAPWFVGVAVDLRAIRDHIASKDARIAALEAERDAWPIWLAEALAFGIDIQPVEPMPSALFDGLVKAWAAIDSTRSEDDWRDLLSAEGVVGATSQPEERTP